MSIVVCVMCYCSCYLQRARALFNTWGCLARRWLKASPPKDLVRSAFSAVRTVASEAGQLDAGKPKFWPGNMEFPTSAAYKGDGNVLELLLEAAASGKCGEFNLEAVAEAIVNIKCVTRLVVVGKAPSTLRGRQ